MWAAADIGVFHWDGGSWSSRTPDSWQPYYGALLWGIATDDVTAWNGSNHCFHWNGDSWSTMECPPAAYQGGAGPGEPWFYDSGDRVFLRFHGGTWERYPSPFPAYRSVWSPVVDAAWAISYEQYEVSFLLHFDGKSWSSGQTIPHHLTRLGGSAPDDFWAVGERGAILHSGCTLEEHRTGSTAHLSQIFGFSEYELWAVGWGPGTLLRHNPTGWERVSVPTERGLASISGVSPTDLWVVGGGDTALHFDGEQWSQVPTGTDGLGAVWASGPADVWASDSHEIGPGYLLHWDGSSWSRLGDHAGVNGFWGFAPDDVWGAGRSCIWLHYSLICSNTISHFDGRSWTARFVGPSGSEEGFRAIWGADPNELWAVGSHTYLWDGKDWVRVNFPELGGCNGVWGRAKDDVFAACGSVVAHWDGKVWAPLRTPSGRGLSSIWGLGSKVWAVGGNGTIFKYEPDKGH